MTASKRLLLTALPVLAVLAAPVAAQTADVTPARRTPLQFSVGMLVGGPTGEFGQNVDAAGGVGVHFDVGLGQSIFSVGGEFTYLNYGTRSWDEDIGSLVPELPNTTVTLTTDNEMVLVHGRLRVQPRRGRWRPYADALYGFNYIFTTTSLEGTCSGSDCYSDISAKNLSDYALSYGAAFGVVVDVGKPGAVRLDVSVRYLRGGQADYLAEGAIHRVDGQAVLDVSRTRTDLVLVYFGINLGR